MSNLKCTFYKEHDDVNYDNVDKFVNSHGNFSNNRSMNGEIKHEEL